MALTINDLNEIFSKPVVKEVRIYTDSGIVIGNDKIYQEAMSLEEALCSEHNPRIGACESACFKIKIASIENHSFKDEWLNVVIGVKTDLDGYLIDADDNYIVDALGDKIRITQNSLIYVGRYKVFSDEPSGDRLFRNLTCYDAMRDILTADVTEWYNNLATLVSQGATVSSKMFRTSFFTYLLNNGLTFDYEDIDLPMDSYPMESITPVTSMSGKTVIESICEINGVFGHVIYGKFTFISLDETSEPVTLDHYVQGTATYEDYTVKRYTSVGVYDINDKGVGFSVWQPNDGSKISIRGNLQVFGYRNRNYLIRAAQNFSSSKTAQAEYRPYTVTTYGNPGLRLGQRIIINTPTETIDSFVIKRSLVGIQGMKDTYTATGDMIRESDANSSSTDISVIGNKIDSTNDNISTLGSWEYVYPSAVSIPTATWRSTAEFTLKPGKWLIIGHVIFNPNATGTRAISVSKNIDGGADARSQVQQPAGGDTRIIQIVYYADVTEDTLYHLNAYQASGGNLNTTGRFMAVKVGL